MVRASLRLLPVLMIALLLAPQAHAQLGIGPFQFSFVTESLMRLFLLPLNLLNGC